MSISNNNSKEKRKRIQDREEYRLHRRAIDEKIEANAAVKERFFRPVYHLGKKEVKDENTN